MSSPREEGKQMTVLVTYASKHGSTRGIAERIAEKLRQLGRDAEVRPVDEVSDPGSYEAFVIGLHPLLKSGVEAPAYCQLDHVECCASTKEGAHEPRSSS
jgi:flavodoxin